MNKKKIIKIVSAILGVVVFIFICNQMGEILDNRRVRLEVEKDRAERQEKKSRNYDGVSRVFKRNGTSKRKYI